MRTIKLTTGAALTLDGDLLSVLEALYMEVTAQARAQSTFEDMAREIQHLIEQMNDDERRQYLVRKPVSQHRLVRERAARRVREEAERRSRPPVSLNYLATRFTCSWPWSTMVLLCDGRMVCGCADPYGKRVLGDTRTVVGVGDLDRRDRLDPAPRHQRRRLEVLRRLPAQAAAEEGRTAAAAPARRRPAAVAPLHRVHRRLQHLVQPGLLRAGDRHHPHAPGRHARLRPVHAGRGRGRAVARPDRLLQLRRGVPAQARARDGASTSSRATRTSTSTRARTASR